MELIRESALFTALLHCALATSLPIAYHPNPYVPVPYIPDKGILPTPYSEVDKIDLPRLPYVITPSWHDIPPFNKPEVSKEENKSQTKKPPNPIHKDEAKNRRKPELDLILPNVKLGLAGLSGMVSKYKKEQERLVAGPELPTVVIKPGRNRPKPDEQDKLPKYKEGQPMFKPENTDLYFKALPSSYRYTKPAKPELPRNIDYTTASETDYGQFKAEEQRNFDDSSYTSMSYDYSPDNIYRTTLSSLKNQAIHTSPYAKQVAQKPTYNYRPTQPIAKGEKQVELPPVPKTMPLLRRIYIALLNTISGLPGGNTGVLDSVRAG